MKYAVVIATRNEPDLQATVADIKSNSSADVIVMEDREGIGPQRMRHDGIVHAAGYDVVIIMDGHMRIRPGALDIMSVEAEKGNTVTCARCYHHHELWGGNYYGGAKINWKSHEFGNQYWALSGKWRSTADLGEIGCVMGACYGFRRDWYMDGIHAPWSLGHGWGVDEEILSITTWLAGGKCILTPAEVWHRARAPRDVPYTLNTIQAAGVWANRFQILDCLTMPHNDRKELTDWMCKSELGFLWEHVTRMLKSKEDQVSDYRERFAKLYRMPWEKWKSKFIKEQGDMKVSIGALRARAKRAGIKLDRKDKREDIERKLLAGAKDIIDVPVIEIQIEQPKPTPPPPETPPQIEVRKRQVCEWCDAVDSFRAVHGAREAALGKVTYKKCNNCGHKLHLHELI